MCQIWQLQAFSLYERRWKASIQGILGFNVGSFSGEVRYNVTFYKASASSSMRHAGRVVCDKSKFQIFCGMYFKWSVFEFLHTHCDLVWCIFTHVRYVCVSASYDPVYVCLSVTSWCWCSIEIAGQIKLIFVHGGFFWPMLHCAVRKFRHLEK